MYIRYENDPPKLDRSELRQLAKNLSEACMAASPDGNHNCSLSFDGAGTEHLHIHATDKGTKDAEWYTGDTIEDMEVN